MNQSPVTNHQSGTPRILISRLSAIGDCILTMPVACALREKFPQAFIAWIVEPAAEPLLRGHRCLDQIIVAPKGWLKSPSLIRNIRRQLRALQFDVTIDPQSLTKSSVAARLSGARRRIGFSAPRGRELSVWLNNELIQSASSHLVDAQLELLRPLGIEQPQVTFDLPHDKNAELRVKGALHEMHLSCPFAVINVGAGWDSRLWPPARYARVAKHLGQQWRMPSLVVWANPRERAWAEEVVAGAGGHGLLAPPTSLPELAVVMREAHMYLGSDTGPMHLASAVGTPCVALFGTTRPEQSGPYGASHFPIQARYQGGSSRERRAALNDAMREITVEAVCQACDSLLAQNDHQNSQAA